MILDAIRRSSKGSRSIIIGATNICRFLDHANIRLGHFMLALLKHHRNRKLALIETSKIGVDQLIGYIYRILPPLNPARSSLFGKDIEIGERGADLPVTKTTVRMICIAMREAEKLNSEYIEPEHLLLARLCCARGKLQKLLMKTFPIKK